MVVTVVSDVLGKSNNGVTIAAWNLIRYLQGHGHEVRVVCPDEERKGEPGFYVVPLRSFGPLNPVFKANGVRLAAPDQEILKEAIDGADAVHIMLPFKLGKAAAKYADSQRIPVTAGFHMMAENVTAHIGLKNFRLMNREIYKYIHGFYKYCFAIHYPTRYLRLIYEDVAGPTNGYVISNGVNSCFHPIEVKRSRQFEGKYVIVFTGRYSKEKSHDVLIDGVNQSKYRDKIQLVFAGAGPRRDEIERYSERLPIKPVFRFFSREELVKLLNMADLYVHPAEIEAEGISCLEALSSGLVPIISDSPRSATKEYAIDEKNLFRYNDPADLAAKIDWWLEHPEERAERGREYVAYAADRFDQDACMAAMEGMIEDAVHHIVRHAAKAR